MRKIKHSLLLLTIIIIPFFLCSCWNYREIESFAIVSGVAIDQSGDNGKYNITVEIIDINRGQNTKISPTYITFSGYSMFNTSRNIISISGKKLYWGHAKCIIISKAIAEEGIIKVIDWFIRDAETRTDMNILISKDCSAKEILTTKPTLNSIVSLELAEQLRNEKNLSTAPVVDLWKVIDDLMQEGISTSISTVTLDKNNPSNPTRIEGLAIFKGDKLIGTLDSETTKYILFAKNEIKGGVLTSNKDRNNIISFKILNNKTQITPIISTDNVKFNIFTKTTVNIDEIHSQKNFYTKDEIQSIENQISIMLEKSIYNSIKKIQMDFGSDILGFGRKLYEDNPQYWKNISTKWSDLFKTVEISVSSEVQIINSGTISKPIEMGD